MRLTPEDCAEPAPGVSAHAMGVNHLVAALPTLLAPDAPPEVLILGIAVGEVRCFDDRLSAPVRNALDTLVARIRDELGR